MAATTASIGFVGLGHMGGNMAARLLGAGYTVYGEERHREHAENLVDSGLRWCNTPRDIAETADVIFTSVPDDTALEEVAASPHGILAGLSLGKTWVEMSTVSPEASRELAQRARWRGATMLDAPVSGSVPQVKAGTLTIMVGGPEHAYDLVEPVLRELGTPVHIGPNGQGLVLKLAINISLAVQMLAFAEGLLLAEKSGVDRQRALDVMTASSIGSPMVKARASIIFDLPDEAWFPISFMQKDIELARDAGRQLDLSLPTTDRADEILEQARAMGYEHRDLAAVFELLEQLATERGRAA
jgi:3-hydroxyisobutyrate dehydrogenase-like beta-hydroxyacid dehydrogenase